MIGIVKRDISYKTEESTRGGRFNHAGTSVRGENKIIFWNDGYPSKKFIGKRKYSTSLGKADTWNLNVVRVPFNPKRIDGRWILQLENMESTELWHSLKEIIESREKNPGIIQMVCPPKQDRKSRTDGESFTLQLGVTTLSWVEGARGVSDRPVLAILDSVGKDSTYSIL